MEFLNPAALGLGLLAIPILLLYMLRQKRRDRPVSSTLLWQELARDRTANAPWQRLRRNLLLLLQLLALACLALALARPAVRMGGRVNGNLIVVLDASASMRATDDANGATRFQEATAHVERLIAGLGGADEMTLIAAGRAPIVLSAASGDREALRAALATATPEATAADWPAALALATGLTHGLTDPRLVIVSDGGLPDGLPAVPAEVTYLPVGRSDANLAIAALGVRPADGRLEALINVTNHGAAAAQALLSLYADGALLDSRQIDAPPGETTSLSWAAPATAQVLEAHLEPRGATADYLALDNQAWTVTGGEATHRVWLASDGNLFLERFFAVLPGYEIVRATDVGALPTPEDGGNFAFYVFDGVSLPATLPEGNVLIINPQPSAAGAPLQVTGSFTTTHSIVPAAAPLLTDVDWRPVHVAEGQTITAPGLVPLITAEGGPLLLAGEIDGRRAVVIPFDLNQSDLPLQIAFPTLMANIAAWLSPGNNFGMTGKSQPGSVVSLVPDARAVSITVVDPNGETHPLTLDETAGAVLFADTQEPGIYTVVSRDGDGVDQEVGKFAINFFEPDESRIQPATTLRLGQLDVPTGRGPVAGVREIGHWLLWGGLLILLGEWWVAYRRRTDPATPRLQ